MTKPRISQVLLWLLVAVTVILFGFFVALVAGAIPVGDPPPPPDTGLLRDAPADEAVNGKEHKLHSGTVSSY